LSDETDETDEVDDVDLTVADSPEEETADFLATASLI